MEEDRDLVRRVERLEDGQRTCFEMANYVRRGQDADTERLARIEADLGILKNDVGTLQRDVGTLKNDVGTLKNDVGTLKGDVGTLKGGMIEVRGQLNRLEVAMTRNEQNVSAQFEWLRGHIANREQGER